ncbi:MAG: hypothetical protein PUB22_08030 [Clostridiales bacterium]|nr:hypothetical protein [Clostridiales bacterium]
MEEIKKRIKNIGKIWVITVFLLAGMLLCADISLASSVESPNYHQTAGNSSIASVGSVRKYGMLPIYGRDVKDGVYSIEVESSSSKFRIVHAELTVTDGDMTAEITLSGTGYLKLFMGTGEEAAESDVSAYIGYEETDDGYYVYTVPVEALDKEIDCAAFSKRREMWYDRKILFEASALPEEALLVELPDYDLIEDAMKLLEKSEQDERKDGASPEGEKREDGILEAESQEADRGEDEKPDNGEDTSSANGNPSEAQAMEVHLSDGEYGIDVVLAGGSGKASVTSPTLMIVRDGRAYARVEWSSSSYDYMVVDGTRYDNLSEPEISSVFEIPITVMDQEMQVLADTTAMGVPHEIAYTLTFYQETITGKAQMPQEAAKRVVVTALIIIVVGGVLNYFVKKKRRQ